MRSRRKKLSALIIAIIMMVSSVILPFSEVHADIAGGGEEKAKNFLYSSAMLKCFERLNNNWSYLTNNLGIQNLIEPQIEYNQSISSIFRTQVFRTHYQQETTATDLSKVYIGTWLGDENGYIDCADAIDHAVRGRVGANNSVITQEELQPGGLLHNVYEESSATMNVLGCAYAIVNSQATDYILNNDLSVRFFSWPQGYYQSGNGLSDRLNSTPILFKYSGDGRYMGYTGGDSDINPSMDNIIRLSWSRGLGAEEQCRRVLMTDSMKIFPVGDGGYTNIYYVDETAEGDNVLNEWGIHQDDSNKATFGDFNDAAGNPANTFSGNVAQISTPGIVQLIDNTQSWLLTNLVLNIKNTYFAGQNPDYYYSNNRDIQYIILGRYLFNGDGAMTGKNCGGISVLEDDPNFSSLDQQAWNIGLPYVSSLQAYAGSDKVNIRTKFDYDADNNQEKTVILLPAMTAGNAERLTCSSVASSFSSITVTSSYVKNIVYGYINPININGDGSVPTPYDPSNPDSPETTDVNCYTNAGAIGWILCPITESGGKFVQEIYDKFIEPQLVLDSGLFNRDNQGGEQTYEAWQTFRNLANIAFVAVFLFVIFSQLTGFGIDNYGIKKILPKMIVAAIIVNVSYFICQIAIDLANIVGYGIKNIMATVGTVPESSQFAIYESGHTLSVIKADLGIAALVGALVVPAVLGQGVGILIAVFTAVIGIVVAILTLFVVLAARKTLSLVLVVISPLAFLCYMLPNTKKLFNKWLDALKGTLLAFPICAGMVFGGQAVSRIVMLSSSNVNGTPFFMTLIAAATAVAPIFLIPSVLKKSMGAISGVIDRASHGVSRFGKSRWQGSQSARRLKEAGAAYQEEREVNRAKRALYGGKFSKGLMGKKELSRRQALAVRKHARTLNAYDKGTAEAYETIMESAGLEKAQDVLSGTSDVNASIAALGKINGIDAKETENELRKYTSSDAFYNLSAADQMKFANACRDMKDNPMAQAYGKLLANMVGQKGKVTQGMGASYGEMDESGALNGKIRGLDNNALVNANKDIFKKNDLSRFSAEQIKAAAVSHFSGEKLTEFNKAVASMSEERRMEVLSKITGGTDWSNMRSDTLEALGGKEIIDKMRASGAYAGMETGIKGLENAQELHASTDSDVLTALGITPGAKAEAAAKAQADAMKAQADALNELNQHLKAQNTNQYGVGNPGRRFPPSPFDGGNA